MFSFSGSKAETEAVDVQESQEYDPHEERQVEHPTSKFETLMNLLKSVIGTGIYAMPIAFSLTGLLTGVLMTIFTALLSIHCIYMLLGSANKLCRMQKMPSMTYPEVGEAACANGPDWIKPYGKGMKVFISVIIGLAYFGTCSVYTVIVAENIEQIIRYYFNVDMAIRIYLAILLVPAILICWVPHLKYFAPISMIANVVTFLGIAITFYYCFTDMPPISERPLHVSVSEIPSFFGVAVFAMSAVGVVMPLANSMKKPSQMTETFGVLSIGTGVTILIYALFGFFGFLRYGEQLKGSITLNLPTDEIPAQVVKIFVALAIFFTIGIKFYVLVETIWNPIKHKFTKSPILANYILRTFMISLAVSLAIAMPTIGPFVSLVGAFCYSIICLMIPVFIEIMTRWNEGYGKWNWIIWKNVAIFALGLIAFFVGTQKAISDIAGLYKVQGTLGKSLNEQSLANQTYTMSFY